MSRRRQWALAERRAFRFARAVVLVACAANGLAGCRGRPPVATLSCEPTALVLPAGSFTTLHLALEPRLRLEPDPAPARPIVFVHLNAGADRPAGADRGDAAGQVQRTFDHSLPADWRLSRPLGYDVTLYQSLLAPPLPPGEYPLTVGLYQPGGERWPLATAGREAGRSEYEVARVTVPATAPPTPELEWRGGWLELEPGVDRQVLARRWMVDEATLAVRSVPAGGRFWAQLQLVPAPADRLVLAPGAELPSLRVESGCDGMIANLSGSGSHQLRLPVAAERVPCEITLRPNFHVLDESGGRRAVALEGLAWASP